MFLHESNRWFEGWGSCGSGINDREKSDGVSLCRDGLSANQTKTLTSVKKWEMEPIILSGLLDRFPVKETLKNRWLEIFIDPFQIS